MRIQILLETHAESSLEAQPLSATGNALKQAATLFQAVARLRKVAPGLRQVAPELRAAHALISHYDGTS